MSAYQNHLEHHCAVSRKSSLTDRFIDEKILLRERERERERSSAEVSEKDIGTEQCTHVRVERGTTVLGTSPLMLGRRDSERDKAHSKLVSIQFY